MYKKKYKAPALLLAVLLLFSTAAPLARAADIPQGVTAEEIEKTIPAVKALADGIIKDSGIDIRKTVETTLCDNKTINSLFDSVYKAFYENESTLSALGIDTSVKNVAACLHQYITVSKKLDNCKTWDEVFAISPSFDWHISKIDDAEKVIASILSPLNDLIFMMLCGGEYKINGLISVSGGNGYETAIIPLLKTLGADNIPTQSEYTALAQGDKRQMLISVFDSIDGVLKKLQSSPVDYVLNYLPGIAHYLKTDGLTTAISSLLEPLSLKISVFTLPGIASLIGITDKLSSGTDITQMLNTLDLSSLTGGELDLKLAEINLDEFEACGAQSGDVWASDRNKTFITILSWLLDTVKLNPSLLPGGFESFLTKPNEELIKLIIKLFNLEKIDNNLNPSFVFPPHTPIQDSFTPTLTRENYTKVLNEIDDVITEVLTEMAGGSSLSDTISGAVYSNNVMTTLVKAVFSALSGEGGEALSMLGISSTPSGLAAKIENELPSAASSLRRASSWDDVSYISWGFYDGSRSGFKRAFTAVFKDAEPIFDFLLCGGTFTVFDGISINGAAGYNNSVIPILEALGGKNIPSYDEFKKSAANSSVISALCNCIFDIIDEISAAPIKTLCERLPNIVYFLNSGIIKTCIDNLIYPVSNLLKELGMEDAFKLPEIGNINLDTVFDELLSGGELPVKLTKPDFNKLAGLGTAQTLTSKAVSNGANLQYTYITADSELVLVTLLRYFVNMLKAPENAGLLENFSLGGGESEGPDMMSMYVGDTMNELAEMSTDEVIEWLYNLLFAETPKKEIISDDGEQFIPTIIYPGKKQVNKVPIYIGAGVGGAVLLAGIIALTRIDFSAMHERKKHKKEQKKALKYKSGR